MGRSRGIVLRLAALFSVDSLAGGLVAQSLVALYFHLRFGIPLGPLGVLFFAANTLSALSFLAAVPLVLLGRRGRAGRGSVRAFEFLGASLLPIWTGLMILLFLATHVPRLLTSGYCPLVSAPAGRCHSFVDWASHLVWPAVTLTLFYAALYSRMLRHDLRQAEWQRRARVEDGEEESVVRRDVRRYYGGIYAKRIARDLGFGLGFALFIEVIFGLPGLGDLLVISTHNQDGALAAGILVCASIIAVAASLLVDAVCAVLDPRFRSF